MGRYGSCDTCCGEPPVPQMVMWEAECYAVINRDESFRVGSGLFFNPEDQCGAHDLRTDDWAEVSGTGLGTGTHNAFHCNEGSTGTGTGTGLVEWCIDPSLFTTQAANADLFRILVYQDDCDDVNDANGVLSPICIITKQCNTISNPPPTPYRPIQLRGHALGFGMMWQFYASWQLFLDMSTVGAIHYNISALVLALEEGETLRSRYNVHSIDITYRFRFVFPFPSTEDPGSIDGTFVNEISRNGYRFPSNTGTGFGFGTGTGTGIDSSFCQDCSVEGEYTNGPCDIGYGTAPGPGFYFWESVKTEILQQQYTLIDTVTPDMDNTEVTITVTAPTTVVAGVNDEWWYLCLLPNPLCGVDSLPGYPGDPDCPMREDPAQPVWTCSGTYSLLQLFGTVWCLALARIVMKDSGGGTVYERSFDSVVSDW